jgi:hypothetical protein
MITDGDVSLIQRIGGDNTELVYVPVWTIAVVGVPPVYSPLGAPLKLRVRQRHRKNQSNAI